MQAPQDMASAAEAMQLQVDRARRRDAATQKLAASFHALYEQLDANQQLTADQVLAHLLLQLPDAPQRTSRAAAAR
jgi:23S rRNA G2069 N7-methylase RlmK/C1962 C5-methylase RlmI